MTDHQTPGPTPRPGPEPQEGAPHSPRTGAPDPATQTATPPSAPPLKARDMRPEHFPTAPMSHDGRIAWVVGLVSLIGIPGLFIGLPGLAILPTSITMIVVGVAQHGKNPVAQAVGRRAATFGAISLAVALLFFVMLIIVLPTAEAVGFTPGDWDLLHYIIVVPLSAWTGVLGPLIAFLMAIIALTDTVSTKKAEKIYARAVL